MFVVGPAAGPRSYRLIPAWTSKDAGLPIGVTPDDATALMWSERTGGGRVITAVDTRTGKVKWTGAPTGWDVNIDYIRGGKLTADAVIIESNYQHARPAIAALDLDDGTVRWQLPTPGDFPLRLAVTDDAVVAAWGTTTLRGLDVDDGHTAWEVRVEAGCKADELVGDGSLAVVEVLCEKKRYLQSLDPGSGAAGWRFDVSIETESSADNLSVYEDVTVLRDKGRLTIVDETGRELLVAQTPGRADAQVATTDDLVVVAYRDKDRGDIITAIDRENATARWSRPAAIVSLSLAQGRLFALGRLPAPLLPIGLYEIDPAGGRMAVSPTHLLHADYDSLVTVIDDIVVSHYSEGRETPRTIMLAATSSDPRLRRASPVERRRTRGPAAATCSRWRSSPPRPRVSPTRRSPCRRSSPTRHCPGLPGAGMNHPR
ncbi:PQQ-binding-like beta-propeller repeat protein [Catellatospora coxensis]